MVEGSIWGRRNIMGKGTGEGKRVLWWKPQALQRYSEGWGGEGGFPTNCGRPWTPGRGSESLFYTQWQATEDFGGRERPHLTCVSMLALEIVHTRVWRGRQWDNGFEGFCSHLDDSLTPEAQRALTGLPASCGGDKPLRTTDSPSDLVLCYSSPVALVICLWHGPPKNWAMPSAFCFLSNSCS